MLPSLARPFLALSRRAGPRRRTPAFTLIETALALGIVAFALIPLIGLLPVGLQMSRNASDLTIAAQIAQRLSGMVQQSDDPSSTLKKDGASPLIQSYYAFDNEGQPVSQLSNTTTALGSGAAVYSAAIIPAQVVQEESTSPTVSLVDGPKAVSLIVRVVNDPGQRLKSKDPAKPLPEDMKSQAILLPVYLPDNGS